MKIESSAFRNNERIPKKYTGEGEDVSPPLRIQDVPKGTVSMALIVDDPDAPMGIFDHWILWNIPSQKFELKEGELIGVPGINHFKEARYRGPMPPPGPVHRYFFKIYALDTMLNLPEGSTKSDLEKAMKGHILGQGEMFGTYSR